MGHTDTHRSHRHTGHTCWCHGPALLQEHISLAWGRRDSPAVCVPPPASTVPCGGEWTEWPFDSKTVIGSCSLRSPQGLQCVQRGPLPGPWERLRTWAPLGYPEGRLIPFVFLRSDDPVSCAPEFWGPFWAGWVTVLASLPLDMWAVPG